VLDLFLNKLTGSDALIRASRRSNRQAFAELFGRSSITFLHLPPGLEGGLDPKVTKEEFLAHIRTAAKDLSGREKFSPLCQTRKGRNFMLLFTQQVLAQDYAHAYVRTIKRIMPFEVLTVAGSALVRSLGDDGAAVLNAESKFEYELSAEDIGILRKLWAQAPSGHAGSHEKLST
jgi:hypothetical protein